MKRCLGYALFIAVMLIKLIQLHSGLHAQNIDMNQQDKLISIGSLILLSFWTLWLPRRGQTIALLILNVLLTFLIYADMVYYRYFQDFITVPVLLQAGQMDALGESIFSLLRPADITLFADWLLFLCYIATRSFIFRQGEGSAHLHTLFYRSPVNLTRDRSRTKTAGFLRRTGNGAAALLLGSVLTFGPIYTYATTWARDLFTGNWWSLAMYNVTGLIGFHAYDAYQYAKDHLGPNPVLPQQEAASMKLWFAGQNAEQAQVNDSFGKYSGSNIIVIQAEAFMNFMVGASVNGQEVTPNLNALMKESLYFSHYYHQTAQGRTSDADFASNGSLYPLTSGSIFVRYPDHHFDVLPAILKENGYSANAFHAYEGSFWNRQLMYSAMGYDRFYTKKDYTLNEPLGWSLGDKSFLRQSLTAMEPLKQPFYSFLTTLSSHYPYSLPEEVQKLDTGEFAGTIFGDYLEAIHYTDEALGQLAEGLKKDGLWENTILVFYGDHDNSIKETSYYEQFLGKSLTALDMLEIMHQVPLLVHLPGAYTGTIDPKPAGQLDLTPSLLHLLGISRDPYYLMGNNLFSGQERLVTLRSGAFANAELAYLPGDDGQFTSGTCYNLDTRGTAPVKQCRTGFEESKTRLKISDDIMKYDAIRTFKQEDTQ
ncbi:LTA synthase family protein [Paenibacillus sp. BR2-3]|uniref:LTA synthase family protein n=1 Tax=Paenibacillus sp. BR2-3 TaxID=3048494 RepID=UPI003977A872